MPDRPHVLLYTDDPAPGGVAQYNHAVLCALAARGFRVTCVQSPADTPLVRRQSELGVRHRWLPFDTLRDFHTQLVDTAGARALLGEEQPDLVFFSDGCPLSQLAAKRAAAGLGLPFLIAEGLVAPYLARQGGAHLSEVAFLYSQARAVVAVSRENLRLLHEAFGLPRGHGEVIYYGRPERFFAPPDRETRRRLRSEHGIPEDAVLCFTAARLEPPKGYGLQLEAVRRLQAAPPGRRLYFAWAGAGALRAELEAAVGRLAVPDRVRLLGQRWDVADWLDAADLFVLPSEFEGMPLAIMEAMAKGLPVAATAVSGVPEELGPTGRLLPPPRLDPEATVRALVEAVGAWAEDGGLRRAAGAACRERALDLFREERMVEETLRAVDRALLPRGDYVSPGFAVTRPDACFPHLAAGDPRGHPWPYLRREVPHTWYVDRRRPTIGFLSRDEAHVLYNTALRFRGLRALEVGCFLGWSTCHLALAGVDLDVIDPGLSHAGIYQEVTRSLVTAGVREAVRLHPGKSPGRVRELAASAGRGWSLFFIDGDHEAPAPLYDAVACAACAEPDALVLFHDLAAPAVAQGLDYLRGQGWQTAVYQTMQVMGAAWRGAARPVGHRPDFRVSWELPGHLHGHPVYE
jgi:glycosyltransferase involved in cell wall biosynthesis/predicted O-methyltransferase YrrM